MDDIGTRILGWALIGGCGLVVVLVGLAIYELAVSETFSLRKAEWSCTESHTTLVSSGKGLVPITVCDNWRRK